MDAQNFVDNYVLDRHNTHSYKWDDLEERFGSNDLISMWIADMEFKVPDQVIDDMVTRVKHGAFGYSSVSDEYYTAFSNWMENKYNFPLKKEWIRFSTGCVTSIAWMIHAFTKPADHCMILTPVYYPFFNVVTNNDRQLVTVDLDYNDGYFTMNYEAIEQAIVDNNVKLFIQCSPQNPAGRVWTEEELDKVLAICKKHNVLVVSDEIHQDIIMEGYKFMPSAVVSNGKYQDIVITLSSASKTFNLAGLLHAHIIITNSELMKKYDKFASGLNRTEMNILGMTATEAAYTSGDEWLTGLLNLIEENYQFLKQKLNKKLPGLTVCSLEGTYLVLLDFRKYVAPNELVDFIQEKCKLAVDFGDAFGDITTGFIRLNLATDPKYVRQAVQNIVTEIGKL